MHPMAFLHKRTHLCALARGREMFEGTADMTPARFDFLYVIHNQEGVAKGGPYRMHQEEIRRRLGLARQTVWKMVERLVDLAYIVKKPCPVRSRHNVILLTKAGVRLIRRGLGAALTERVPLPHAAPVPVNEGDEATPRYWRRPELSDTPPKKAVPAVPATPPVTESSLLAMLAEESQANPSTPAPNAPTHAQLARWWMEDVIGPTPPPPSPTPPPPVFGREVSKIYSAYAWMRLSHIRNRRRRRGCHLGMLQTLISEAAAMAAALGNYTESIYALPFARDWDL